MISPETIALVRDRTNIVAVIQESVPSLKRRGRSWVGLCPFHKEKTPSFHVNPERGFFHCFGCHESGSAIDFLMKHDGLTFPEAVRALADRCGIEVVEDAKAAGDRGEADRAKKHKDDLYAVTSVAAAFYERQLREHETRAFAIEELQKRGLEPESDVVQQFRIGYAPAAWDSLALHLKSQGLSPALAEEVGLLVPRSSGGGHYDRFRHRLMFSVIDTQGRVVAFSGRALREIKPEADKDPPPKYVNSPESPIYTKGHLLFGLFQARHAIRREDVAVLVEGNFDVVSLQARGLENVVAPLGTAFTDDQARLLRRYASRVVVCFDGDSAGRKATRASREPCRAAGLSSRVATMPQGTDPDALAREKGIDAVKDAVAQARELLRFMIDDALDQSFSAADAFERSARVKLVARLLAEEEDPLVRSLLKTHADEVAGRLDLVRREDSARGDHSPESFRMLQALMEKELRNAQKTAPKPPPAAQRPKKPGALARAEIVGALLDFPDLLFDPEVGRACALLEGDSARVVAQLGASTKTSPDGEKTLYTTEFLAQMPPAIHAFAAKRLASPRLDNKDEAKSVVLSNAEKLRSMMSKRETKELSQELRHASDWETEVALAEEAARRLKSARGLGKD
jgi:DNA primase